MASKYLSVVQESIHSNPGSAQSSITATNPGYRFWKEAGGCLSCSSPGNVDTKWTERSKQLLSLPSPCQAGENEQSLFFTVSVPVLGRRFRQGIPARSIPRRLLPSCIFCTARGPSASFPTSRRQGPPAQDSFPKISRCACGS